ncbi:MAG: aldolase/citrate lyase family protein [Candidatus Hodarchaeota archaeon]
MENSIDKIVGGRLSYPKNTTYNVKKDLLENNKVVVGTMFRKTELLDEMENPTLPHPLVVAKQAGFRIVVIDCEHKAFSQERLATYAKIAHKIGVSLWLRPTQQEEEAISQYADIGFSGFMIPNAVQLPRIRKIVDQAYFPPIANERALVRRGYSISDILLDGEVSRLMPLRKEMNYVNSNMIVTLQTEHPKGIDNLAELLSISREGIIGTIIGPNNLAISLSQFKGNHYLLELDRDKMYEDEVMMRAYETTGRIARDNKKVAGIHFTEKSQVELIKRLINEERFHEYRLILFGTELNLLQKEFDHTEEIVQSIG